MCVLTVVSGYVEHVIFGSLPVQAKANGLALNVVPCELSDLKPLKIRIFCLRVPFMKIVALPTAKQVYPWTSCECAFQIGFNL